MALELKREVVECAWIASRQQLASIFGPDPLSFLEASRFPDVPLELVVEEVLRHSSLTAHDLLGWMQNTTPNNNHRVLGALAERHLADVVTTNFDELVERCVSDSVSIKKLHGTVSNPNSIILSLDEVGRGLVNRRFREKISELLRGKSMCFVGYAGRDPDIFPVLSGLNFRHIVWIARPGKTDADRKVIAEELKQCDRLERISEAFDCFSVDADHLFDELGSMLGLSLPINETSVFDWRAEMSASMCSLSSEEAVLSLLRIFGVAGLWKTVGQACSILSTRTLSAGTRLQTGLIEAEALFWTGDYPSSEAAARRVVHLCQRGRDLLCKARAFQILGLIKSRSADSAARSLASRYMNRVSDILKSRNDIDSRLTLANNFLNLGVWQKNHGLLSEAEESLNDGLRIARKVGDLLVQEKIHDAIGIVLRRRRQEQLSTASSWPLIRRSARRHFAVAKEYASYLGNTAEEVRVTTNLVNLELDGFRYVPGALHRASVLLDECERLVGQVPAAEQAARVKELRGIVLTAKGALEEAIDLLSDAINGMITNTGRASALRSRAEALERMGMSDEAVNDLHEARKLVPEGPDKAGIVMLLKQIEERS